MSKIERLRNIGIIAHIDAGKTTTSERFLFQSGRIHRMGEVHDGDTTMDWRTDEQERGITIAAAASTFPWKDCEINLIDTPGHVDFTAEVERSMRVIDGAVVVLCGVSGVEAQSETVWRQADRYGVPRIAFINKMDRAGADFGHAVQTMRDRLGANPIPIQLPWLDEQDQLVGVIDLIDRHALTFPGDEVGLPEPHDVPTRLEEVVTAARTAMIEAIADFDDAVAEAFLAEEEVGVDRLRASLRRGTLARKCTPVLCGTSLRNIGVQPLLDAVVDLLPSPVDVPPPAAFNPKTKEPVELSARSDEPFAGLVFKVQAQTGGELFYMRVYSGKLSVGDSPICARTGRRDKIHDLLTMHAKSGERVKTVSAGAIVALPGLKQASTGDTLYDKARPLSFEAITFPDPVVSIAIEPKTSSGRDKLVDTLSKMAREDPTFAWTEDEETGQLIVSGMGELHLEIATNRLKDEFRVDANIGKPRVAYRETIATPSTVTHESQRNLGGNTAYGGVTLRVEEGDDLEAGWDVSGNGVPKKLKDQLLEYLDGELRGTGLFGYPLRGVRATLLDVKTRDFDPEGAGLPYALAEGFEKALREGGTRVLEPIMRIEITAHGEYVGAVHRALQAKRAVIDELDEEGGLTVIRGSVPMGEMFGFSDDLRTISGGRAAFSMEPAGYMPIDEAVAKRMFGE